VRGEEKKAQHKGRGVSASRLTPDSPRIYLASRSPRRCELLAQIGIAFEVLPADKGGPRDTDVDETPYLREAPREYVMRIACAKAEAGWRTVVACGLPVFPVLAADTTVVLNDEIIGKPDDAGHARALLQRLSGRTHQVLTAVAVTANGRMETALSSSTVEFRELDDAEIERYCAGGEPLGKAGAYAIQGRAAVFAHAISGSYSGIMGLPLYETAGLLQRFGIRPI
jgi:septum formation protein